MKVLKKKKSEREMKKNEENYQQWRLRLMVSCKCPLECFATDTILNRFC